MDTDIRKTNKIPGCEQLTRPEEIAALSKYLGEIKKIQEEHTKLVDEGLEVPGRTTGRILEVSELEDDVLNLEDTREKTLENTRLGITGDKRTVELGTEREKLEDLNVAELGDAVLSLEDTREKTLENTKLGITGDKRSVELGTEKEKLKDQRETRLETKSEVLEDRRQVTLGDKKEELKDNRNTNLSEKTERISIDPKIDRLETKSEILEDRRQVTLGDKKEELKDNRNTNLSEKTERISIDPKIDRLETKSEILEDQRKQIELETKVVEEERNEQSTLSKYIDSLDAQQENTLGNYKENIQDPEEEPSLIDYMIGLVNEDKVTREVENLGDHKETINPEDVNLETNQSDWLKGVIQTANAKRDEDGLYKTAIHLFSEEGTEWSERVAALMSTYLSSSRISPERAEEFEELLASSFVYPGSTPQQIRPENQTTREGGNYVDPDEIKNNPIRPNLYRREDNNNGDGPTRDHETWDYDENGNYVLTTKEDDARNNPPSFGLYRDNGLIQTPQYDLNLGPADAPAIEKWKNIGIKALNNGGASSYLRYTAEQVIGSVDWARGSLRAQLINEALALLVRNRDQLEKVARINRDRLPGAFVPSLAKAASSGLGSALGQYGYTGYDPKAGVQKSLIKTGINVGKNIAGRIFDKSPVPSEPFNRPKKDRKLGTKTEQFGYGNDVREFPVEYIKYVWPEDRVYTGLGITLRDLCGVNEVEAAEINSLEKLNQILETGELMTTSNKVNKETRRTLDSNMYWEVVMSPWVSSSDSAASNGGYSFLPSIAEINTINKVDSGVDTAYNKWIPISGFELQKSKLTTKSLGLFDGEINYPVTSEYTNELRITVVDDQWKSWKHYFQRCADVAVYNSEPHDAAYYKNPDPLPTAIDKSTLCAAFYKNLAFKISIYIMTPQLATIKKFSLLCILKDYSEDYTGESDSGGSDLSVAFSIVGEINEEMEFIDELLSGLPKTTPPELKIPPEPLKIEQLKEAEAYFDELSKPKVIG